MAKGNLEIISENISWTIKKGSWIVHILFTITLWLIFTQLFNCKIGLQLTVIFYNLITFIFFHLNVGDPFDNTYKQFTFWEQMVVQLGDTNTLKFIAIYPFVLFIISLRLDNWNNGLFIIALISIALVIIPKFGFMHMKRLFGIKRQDK